jgi:transposase
MSESTGLAPLRTFAGTLRRHRRRLVAHTRYPIGTGRLEGVNNTIKIIKPDARLSKPGLLHP